MIFQNRGQFGGQVARSRTARYCERQGTSKWPGFGKLYRWQATNFTNLLFVKFVRQNEHHRSRYSQIDTPRPKLV